MKITIKRQTMRSKDKTQDFQVIIKEHEEKKRK